MLTFYILLITSYWYSLMPEWSTILYWQKLRNFMQTYIYSTQWTGFITLLHCTRDIYHLVKNNLVYLTPMVCANRETKFQPEQTTLSYWYHLPSNTGWVTFIIQRPLTSFSVGQVQDLWQQSSSELNVKNILPKSRYEFTVFQAKTFQKNNNLSSRDRWQRINSSAGRHMYKHKHARTHICYQHQMFWTAWHWRQATSGSSNSHPVSIKKIFLFDLSNQSSSDFRKLESLALSLVTHKRRLSVWTNNTIQGEKHP